jgi:hypothetical protein
MYALAKDPCPILACIRCRIMLPAISASQRLFHQPFGCGEPAEYAPRRVLSVGTGSEGAYDADLRPLTVGYFLLTHHNSKQQQQHQQHLQLERAGGRRGELERHN